MIEIGDNLAFVSAWVAMLVIIATTVIALAAILRDRDE
jgi:hypothetical protein